MGKSTTGKNEVAKIEIASVTQKTAIITETAAAFMARGFMLLGGSIVINTKKEPKPSPNPTNCFLLIFLPFHQKDILKQMEQYYNYHAPLQEQL